MVKATRAFFFGGGGEGGGRTVRVKVPFTFYTLTTSPH